MKQVNRIAIAIVLLISGCGTSLRKESARGYLNFFSEKEQVRTVETQGLKYEVQLLTPEYMALQQSISQGKPDIGAFRTRLDQVSENIYFRIRLYGIPLEVDKAEIIRYYDQRAKNNARLLIENARSVSAEYVSYEDNYGITPYNTLVFCFRVPKAMEQKQITFSFEDEAFQNDIKASYTSQDLNEYPSLTL